MRNKVLIIDDEADVLTYLTTVLQVNGYKPYSINNIVKAMKEVEKIRPDLICLDIMMPRETGISFYKELKQTERFKNIPVIMISGVVQTDQFDFRSYLSDETIPPPERFIEKPIEVDEFIRIVKKLLSGKA